VFFFLNRCLKPSFLSVLYSSFYWLLCRQNLTFWNFVLLGSFPLFLLAVCVCGGGGNDWSRNWSFIWALEVESFWSNVELMTVDWFFFLFLLLFVFEWWWLEGAIIDSILFHVFFCFVFLHIVCIFWWGHAPTVGGDIRTEPEFLWMSWLYERENIIIYLVNAQGVGEENYTALCGTCFE
jgi:hypothetical protein